jgi:energy-coupling factor transport system permease protein
MRPRLQYFEGRSLLHRIHPMVKSAWLLVSSVSLFLVPNAWFILGILALSALGFWHVGAGWKRLRGMRLILLTTLLLAGLQLVFNRSGTPWLRFWDWSITVDGIEAALYVGGRFLGIVLLSYLFVLTTDPGELAHAMMQMGVPYRYGYSLIMALRMVPMFQIEAETIYKAQLARAMRHDRGGLRGLIGMARQMLMPLLVSGLTKADTLAVSMEGRCFGMHRRRTYLRRTSLHMMDLISLFFLIVCTIALAIFRFG